MYQQLLHDCECMEDDRDSTISTIALVQKGPKQQYKFKKQIQKGMVLVFSNKKGKKKSCSKKKTSGVRILV